jgi:glycosyltransferase involved in cell wall biosynthesis
VAGGKWRFGITLPPLNPIERPSYERWKALGTSLRLPMVFEVGGDAGLAYTENMSAADRVLTTSVAEGFGLVFLEPWLAGKPLIGRDLPEITGDFAAAGLRFEHLRASFAVPVAWIGADAFQQDVERWYVETLAQYGLKAPPADLLSGALDALIEDGQVDFAALTSARQAEVIRQVVSHGHRRQQLRARNAWIDTALGDSQADAATVRHNADVVRREYSLDACGRRLMQIYRSALASPRSEPTQPLADAERILGEFLNLSRFQPIRVEP